MDQVKQKILIGLFLLLPLIQLTASRIQFSVNENWQFSKGQVADAQSLSFNDSLWTRVSLPHTWNLSDVKDDVPGYYRDVAWYRKSLNIPDNYAGRRITIFFEGTNQETELFVNGISAGKHAGGYTRFSFDITALIRTGQHNLLAVNVSNAHNEAIPPLSADFTFFGGIYRDVYLIITSRQQISTTHYASSGVYISTPVVKDNYAQIEVKTMLSNDSDTDRNLVLEQTVYSPSKVVVVRESKKIFLKKNTVNGAVKQFAVLKNPRLWSPASPALYAVRTRLIDVKTAEVLDEVMQPLGLRNFEFSVEKGFLLNGKPLKLIGTNRHQCYDSKGNALPDEIHVRDVKMLKEMGGNFLRVSHYPQDPVVMEMCDKLGIITSVEIPIVNAITESEEFTRNSLNMAREMVLQDFNRPSVLIWAYMNEVLLRLPFAADSLRNLQYFSSVKDLALAIENQIRSDDPGRYTLIPFHGSLSRYETAGLTAVPMIIGWNLYQGWYGGTFDKFGEFLDTAHDKLKDKPFIITEYGADVDPRLHSFQPVRLDYTQEYANNYHEYYIKEIMQRPWVVGANIWNLNDFYSEERENAVPHINSKGIVSTTRQVKDTYLHYQALLRKDPVVNIAGRNWQIRGGIGGENYRCTQPVKVYSNLGEVELILNGLSLGKSLLKDAMATFEVPFVAGNNVLEAVGYANNQQVRDLLRIDFRMLPARLADLALPFESLHVMLGSKRYFEDKDQSVIWLPEKEYAPGSWGYVGGKNYVKKTRYGQQPASNSNIRNTQDDPVFQTMRRGIESFRLDVPDGDYTVSLFFAELMSATTKEIIYNLGDDAIADDISERVFDVLINGTPVINQLNPAKEFGELEAIEKKFRVTAQDGKGIVVSFRAISDEPILNAISVYRNY